jgi:hypothetical protein
VIDATTFGLTGSGRLAPATVSYDATLRFATLVPSAQRVAGTTSTVVASGAVSNTAGNRLPSTSWTFSTVAPAPAKDWATPTAAIRTPAGGAQQVNLTVIFSEPVTGLSTTSMTGRTSKGVALSATVTCIPTTRVATRDRTATPARRTPCTAALTTGTTGPSGCLERPAACRGSATFRRPRRARRPRPRWASAAGTARDWSRSSRHGAGWSRAERGQCGG